MKTFRILKLFCDVFPEMGRRRQLQSLYMSSLNSTHNRPNAQPVGHHHARFYRLIGHPDASVPLLAKHKFVTFSSASHVSACLRSAAAIRRL